MKFTTILISFAIAAHSGNPCEPESSDRGPTVRFPFRLKGKQPENCGYPGFDLYCKDGDTIIDLPKSGEFVVTNINYRDQFLYIDDPDSCLPNRSLSFNLSGSPFRGIQMQRFTYFNCSGSWTNYPAANFLVPLTCLSGENNTVVAVNSRNSAVEKVPPLCRRMVEIAIPLQWSFSRVNVWLGWSRAVRCARVRVGFAIAGGGMGRIRVGFAIAGGGMGRVARSDALYVLTVA